MLRVATKVRSSMLVANAWHARSDAASSFLVAVGINIGGEPHHLTHENLYLYADPINGELLPFLREVSSIDGENNIVYNYDTLKQKFYNYYTPSLSM